MARSPRLRVWRLARLAGLGSLLREKPPSRDRHQYQIAPATRLCLLPSLVRSSCLRLSMHHRPVSLMMVIRSLAWFEDADAEPEPISLLDDNWPTIRKKSPLPFAPCIRQPIGSSSTSPLVSLMVFSA